MRPPTSHSSHSFSRASLFGPAPAWLAGLLCATWILLAPSGARAADFPLLLDLQHRVEGDFGNVHVDEDGSGGLAFELSIDPEVLGSRAHLDALYFNLDGHPAGLQVISDDPVALRYRLRRRRGAAVGARFDRVLSFGRDRGRHGNGTLQTVRFTLRADTPLAIDDLLPLSFTARGDAVQMAARIKRTRIRRCRRTVVVGGVLQPEPQPTEPPPVPDPNEIPIGCQLIIDLMTGEPVLYCP